MSVYSYTRGHIVSNHNDLLGRQTTEWGGAGMKLHVSMYSLKFPKIEYFWKSQSLAISKQSFLIIAGIFGDFILILSKKLRFSDGYTIFDIFATFPPLDFTESGHLMLVLSYWV